MLPKFDEAEQIATTKYAVRSLASLDRSICINGAAPNQAMHGMRFCSLARIVGHFHFAQLCGMAGNLWIYYVLPVTIYSIVFFLVLPLFRQVIGLLSYPFRRFG